MSERSFSQKLVDNVFGGAPYGWLTSDRGVELSQLSGLKETLDHGLASLEREIGGLRPGPVIPREPIYLPTPEVYIDTSELASAQHEVADRLSDVVDAQRDLVEITKRCWPCLRNPSNWIRSIRRRSCRPEAFTAPWDTMVWPQLRLPRRTR